MVFPSIPRENLCFGDYRDNDWHYQSLMIAAKKCLIAILMIVFMDVSNTFLVLQRSSNGWNPENGKKTIWPRDIFMMIER